MAHKNIPIFIPHLGCPNQCVFCNQRSISGCHAFDESTVEKQISEALNTMPQGSEAEIAFFGGSFTGIDRALMLRLLNTAERYVQAGSVRSIRLSTRPDYIDAEILEILSRYSVKTIELGLQSMDDEVLLASKRGHTAEQAREACRAVLEAGFALVGQMMIGLPMSDAEKEIMTAQEICRLGASAVRIYPTVVFYDTPLCEMAMAGAYKPITVEEACVRSAKVLEACIRQGVACIRIGLCATESLTSSEKVFGGPNHPALGELVWNAYYYEQIKQTVCRAGLAGEQIVLRAPTREISKIVGQHRCNLIRLQRETDTRICKVVGDDTAEGITALPYANEGSRRVSSCI